MTEYKNFKAQVCDVVDCKNEKQKSLCPDKCDKGESFLLTPLWILLLRITSFIFILYQNDQFGK